MGKKLLLSTAVLVLGLVAVPAIWVMQDSMGGAADVYLKQAIVWGAVYMVNGLVFGALTSYISRMKGYESGFAWGFWLGLIGLLVVGFRPAQNQKDAADSDPAHQPDEMEKLAKLAKLHEQGVLSDEEFQQKKKELLAKI